MPTTPQVAGLQVRILADKSTGTREKFTDPQTGQSILINPATPGYDHEPWPLAGLEVEINSKTVRVSQGLVAKLVAQGLVTIEGEDVQVVTAGPPEDPWRIPPHVFRQADALVFHTTDGDLRLVVTHSPGKYTDNSKYTEDMVTERNGETITLAKAGDPIHPAGYRIDWFYDCKPEG